MCHGSWIVFSHSACRWLWDQRVHLDQRVHSNYNNCASYDALVRVNSLQQAVAAFKQASCKLLNWLEDPSSLSRELVASFSTSLKLA